MTILIETHGLHVRYVGRATDALADVSMTVSAGSIVGVTGRTGAGKTTLALTAAGFVPRVVRAAVRGSVDVAGVSAIDAPAKALAGRVGIVFSTPAHQLSASKLSVREELAFGLENLGVPPGEMDARIDATLERLGIAHLAERDPLSLSGGEQQRVAIASIIVMGPHVLVLDEPVAQLDPGGAGLVGALLAQLAAEGAAILCAEHTTGILGSADRLVVLDAGTMVVDDVPGAALSSRVLDPLGYPTPTLVQLAEAAGLPAALAFDEDAVTHGLAALHASAAGGSASAPTASPTGPEPPVAEFAPSATEPPTIELVGLVHRYPGAVRAAVDDVSLLIEPGESVAIVGQNGSGKTTLVKHLDGLLRPTSGTVRLAGRDIAARAVHELALEVGFVFQDPDDQLFERTVEREVAFGPRRIGVPGGQLQDRIARALELVDLAAEARTNPYDLGLSQRKMVALASVLAMSPGVLVLDEPTSGQDPVGVARIATIVRGWAASGRTVITITHDMAFAASAFRRVVVMGAGRVLADGPSDRVLSATSASLLAGTGLVPPPAARIAGRLGLTGTPADAAALLASLRARAAS